MRKPVLITASMVLSCLLLAACAPAPQTAAAPGVATPADGPCDGQVQLAGTPLRQIRILARANANRGQPTPLDLVFIYRPALFHKLPRDAAAWFDQRDELRKRHGGMQVVSLAIVPGSGPAHIDLPDETGEVHRVLAYPLYRAPSARRALELTRFERVRLTLEENTITTCRE